MAFYTVTSVPTSTTLAVSPGWVWRGERGCLVEPLWTEAAAGLDLTLVGRTVTIGRAVRVESGRLVCEVYLDGVRLTAPLPCPQA